MRNGSLLNVIVLCGIVLRLPAQEPPPRAATVPADDVVSSGIQVKVFAVRKGDATALAEMLGTLLGQGSSGVRPLQIVPEPRTNSILAVGAAGDLEVIRALLARLEDPSSYRLQPMVQSAPSPAAAPVRSGIVNQSAQKSPTRFPQPAPRADAAPVRNDIGNPKAVEALRSINAKSPREDINEAEVRLKSAKAELERQEALRNQGSAVFSSSEMARARLAARLAEIQLEQPAKPPGERWKAGFNP